MESDTQIKSHAPNIQRKVSLRERNTFGFDVCADHHVAVSNDRQLVTALDFAERHDIPVLVLGGGSNVVLTRDVRGLVVQLCAQKITYDVQSDGRTHVKADAGVNWHRLVLDTLERGYAGLENLSLIPGTVGAAPIQNIGAYGVELVDRFVELRAWHRPTRSFRTLALEDCQFSYRDSRLKRELDDWIVVSVTLEVGRSTPLVTDYSTLASQLECANPAELTARAVSDAVIAIRQQRLPDPAVVGNAGSFFQNPVVSKAQFMRMSLDHPGIINYPMADGRVKLAAGWMIDKLGFKGLRRGAVGVHHAQALVMVNHGDDRAAGLLRLVADIQASVLETYGIQLTIEPRIV